MATKAFDAVVFDLDGTLLDTLADLTNATNFAMRESGFPEHTHDEVRTYVGDGIGMLIRRALPKVAQGDEEAFVEALQAFKLHYDVHQTDLTVPYAGITEMLDALAAMNIDLAIVSNKSDANVKALTREHFAKWVDVAVGEQPGVRRKPCPDSLLRVMQELSTSPERTLYVGDSETDLQTAKNAGVPCASVCWGFRSKEELEKAGAKHLFETPTELLHFIVNQ